MLVTDKIELFYDLFLGHSNFHLMDELSSFSWATLHVYYHISN